MGQTRWRGLRPIASALRRKLISSVASPLRKKSRLLRLFACKRTLNASASLPTFCEYGTGTLATTLGANQPFRYRGYVYDTETGWYYLQSRYYNPEVGRFISSDVLLSTGQGVLGHNSYAYCLNNPINMSDPSGLDAIVLYDSSGLGHIGILIQDDNGTWWHFYWGAGSSSSSSSGRITCIFGDVEAKTWCLKYECTGIPTIADINDAAQYSGSYDKMKYLYGDYSICVSIAQNPTGEYNLYTNNCSQYSLSILASADTGYSDQLSDASDCMLPSKAFSCLVNATMGCSSQAPGGGSRLGGYIVTFEIK
ncbi:MAG: RHS repeat-associated core domain-containing protein [Eubacteriales bacterium]|nr:RHS repeat-associated core domain-containing protein [Eubacteriales bacterium]